MTPEVLARDLVVFDVDNVEHSTSWGNKGYTWAKPQTPGLDIHFYSSSSGSCSAKVKTANGTEVSSVDMEADKGLNILSYDLAFSKKGKSNFLKKNKMKLTAADNGKTYLPKGKLCGRDIRKREYR